MQKNKTGAEHVETNVSICFAFLQLRMGRLVCEIFVKSAFSGVFWGILRSPKKVGIEFALYTGRIFLQTFVKYACGRRR